MKISAPFIRRPIATALLMVGLLAAGLITYPLLPVAALPNVNYPTLTVTAQLPGADPQTVASTVASPLELQFGEIPGLTQMTSASALGYVQITLQFEMSRQIDGAVSDTLSAIQAATAYLPKNMPYPPSIRKVNPADTPILVLAATSDTLPLTVVDAYAQNILLQKRSRRFPGSGSSASEASSSRRCACRSIRKRSQLAASISKTCARCSARRTLIFRKGPSTARVRPTPSIPTISCLSPTNMPI
jgi:multidrug efflux pump subunit AcrB